MASHADRKQMLSEQRFQKAAHRVGSSARWAAGKNVQPCIVNGPGMYFSTEHWEPDSGTFFLQSQIACQTGKNLLPSMLQLHRIAIFFCNCLSDADRALMSSLQSLLHHSPPLNMWFEQTMHGCMEAPNVCLAHLIFA